MSNYQQILSKLHTVADMAKQIEKWKMAGDRVIFTNGCFDILHKGHVTYLAQAADFGTKLVIGINADESVKRLGKGDDRPINSEDARALLIASLGFVDGVVVFNDDTPIRLIEQLQPDVLVKGADYDADETDPTSKKYIVGRETVMLFGGIVKTVPLVAGFSTTGILNKIRD
ncbi:MAG: adenylyltransferase/cytidyltransferase family protein [Moraxellaceae bacterium]|jgi:rfaE bifunctional protein nucleotidyltransferase chain/domain